MTEAVAAADARRLFDELAERLLSDPRVEEGTGFGRMPGLRTGNRIFAMLCRGELVVKLPRERVDELVAAGAAARFDARRDGRPMKEWASVPPEHAANWGPIAHEALHFVSASASALPR